MMIKKKHIELNKIFVGGDFQILQYLWLVPVLNGYCSKNNVQTIIFEYKKDLENLMQTSSFLKFSKTYNIVYLDDILPLWFKFKILQILILFLSTFFLAIKVRYFKKLFLKDNHSMSIYTGIYDFAFRGSKNLIYPSFYSILFSSFYFLQKHYKAKFLVKNNISSAFLGHSVYHSRAFFNEFRKNQIRFFCSSWNLYLQKNIEDTMWDFPSLDFFRKAFKFLKNEQVDNYWNKRLIGKGNYEGSNNASSLGEFKEEKIIKNIIFLHIFKDTPNHYIDNNKIFNNYVDWVTETLKIISFSNEDWLIKLHPSYIKWGEDQPKIIEKIISVVSRDYNLNNVYLDDLKISNISIFKNAHKIITYSGTSAIEAACFGIKPITISANALHLLDKKIVYKPINIEEYRSLILKKWKFEIFSLDEKEIIVSKKLLFIRENILNLLSEIEYNYIYVSKEYFSSNGEIFKKYSKTINKKKSYLTALGESLGNSLTHTISENYLNYILKNNL